MHKIHLAAGIAEFEEGGFDLLNQGTTVIVAQPALKEVAKNVERVRLGGVVLQKLAERPGDIRALLVKVQV